MLKRKENNSITEGVIWKAILTFFFPILLGTFFQQMYNTVDAIVVGKYVGKEALAAVGGATGSLINLIVGFFVGLSSGATVILSQYWGARNREGAEKTVHTAMAMVLIFGVVLTAFGMIYSPSLLKLMGLQDDVMLYAAPYIRIYFSGTLFSLVYNIGSGLLRAVGDSRRPLYFLIAACIVNIVLDILFTVGFDMGVEGAALATVLSQVVSSVLVVVTLVRSQDAYRLQFRKIRLEGQTLRAITRIGLPTGLQSVLFSISNTLVQSAMNRFDANVLAGYTAYGKLDAFQWMVLNAFGIAISTFVGQNVGAGQMQRVKKGVGQCLAMSSAATVGFSVVYLLFGKPLLSMFANDSEVLSVGAKILTLIAPFFLTYVPVEILGGSLRGAGNSLAPTLMTLAGICVTRVIWVLWIAPITGTVELLLWCYPVTWILTSLLHIFYYRFGKWTQPKTNRKNQGKEDLI